MNKNQFRSKKIKITDEINVDNELKNFKSKTKRNIRALQIHFFCIALRNRTTIKINKIKTFLKVSWYHCSKL